MSDLGMTAVILLAGMGRRMGLDGEIMHKSLTRINGVPIIQQILDNIKRAGIENIVPVLGYKSDDLKKEISHYWGTGSVSYIYNDKYNQTNNLYSLWLAGKDMNRDFVVMNGDMIFDYRILQDLVLAEPGTYLSIDTTHKDDAVDSPGVEIDGEYISNWELRMSSEKRAGYATGIYRIGMDMKDEYFKLAEEMLNDNMQCTYGDPITIITRQKKIVKFKSTKDYLWTDVDEIADIERAENYMSRIKQSQEAIR